MPRTPSGVTPLKECTPSAAYQRGLQTARLKVSALRTAYNAAFQAIKERAERAESKKGLGACGKCKFFSAQSPQHMWGHCDMASAQKQHPDWPNPWAHLESEGYKMHHRLTVAASFGCVNFKARP